MDELYKRGNDIPRILISQSMTTEDIEVLKKDLKQNASQIDWEKVKNKAVFYMSGVKYRPEKSTEVVDHLVEEISALPEEKVFIFNLDYVYSAGSMLFTALSTIRIDTFLWHIDAEDIKLKEVIEEYNEQYGIYIQVIERKEE